MQYSYKVGNITVSAATIEQLLEAIEVAKACPLSGGGSGGKRGRPRVDNAIEIAKRAQVSLPTARKWLRGSAVTHATEQALVSALLAEPELAPEMAARFAPTPEPTPEPTPKPTPKRRSKLAKSLV